MWASRELGQSDRNSHCSVIYMGTGIGIDCLCCGNQLDYEIGFNKEKQICDTCEKETIPMVLKYLGCSPGVHIKLE
jgi:hypothetical protein